MDVSGIAGAGKSHLLKQVQEAAVSVGESVAILSPTDASVKNLRKTGFRARTFQGFQLWVAGDSSRYLSESLVPIGEALHGVSAEFHETDEIEGSKGMLPRSG